MATANSTTSITRNRKSSTDAQGASAEPEGVNSQKFSAVPADKFDSATLKLDGARALVTMFGIFAGETGGDKPLPVSEWIISSAMSGIVLLIGSAVDDLLAREGGAE